MNINLLIDSTLKRELVNNYNLQVNSNSRRNKSNSIHSYLI